MFNQSILKQLSILFVEDDEFIRSSLVPLFEKLFKEVYVGVDGLDGLKTFTSLYEANNSVDIILSDVNMPNMNGIDMLKKIREYNTKIPLILSTAYSDSEYLMEAIKLGVSYYAVKPINTTELLGNIQKLCESKLLEKAAETKQKELEEYLEIINKVALVSKTDLKGTITYANDIFCEVSGYDKEDLIGKPHNIVRHPDMPKEAYAMLWQTIQSGKVWKGKVKNRAKNAEAYFVNATVFPIFDQFSGAIIEYIAIRFLTTDEEHEKREFKKKVIQNIQETKQKEAELKNKIKFLEDKLKLAENIDLIQEVYKKEKDKNHKLQNQIYAYEKEISSLNTKIDDLLNGVTDKPNKIMADLQQLKVKYDACVIKNKDYEIELNNKEREILRLGELLQTQTKIITNFKDVIAYQDKELGEASKR